MRAIFLDKDGTLVEDIPFNVDPGRMVLTRNTGPGLRLLRNAGYEFFVISNQAGVGMGLFPESALEGVHRRLAKMLADEGIVLRDFYYCPHTEDASCACRKPMPGLLQCAAHEYGIDLEASWMVGDILNDVEAGRRAGCRTVLIDNGNETQWLPGPLRLPHARAADLLEAAQAILSLAPQEFST